MARPTVNTQRLGSIYVKPELAQRLDALSEREGRTINDIVRSALVAYLDAKDA